MATPISDAMYNTSHGLVQMRGDLSKPLQMPVMSPFSNTNLCRVPDGMEQLGVWSSWKTGGSDRTPADYPCALNDGACPSEYGEECGKSLILRENSIWPQVTGSADGSGYVTTNWLPPNTPSVRLGFCEISRRVVPFEDPANEQVYPYGTVSLLLLDGQPLLHYWSGRPFYFHTEKTPFVYMVPNAIMARVGGTSYRVDVMSAAQRGQSCENCI